MADIRIKDMPAESSPADGDQFEIDSTAAGGRRVSLATLKTVIPAAIQPASATVRGGMKLTDSPADPTVYSTGAADARFTAKPVPMADLPSYAQFSGPTNSSVAVAAGDWIRVAKWPAGTAIGSFSVALAEYNNFGIYDISLTFTQALGSMMVRCGTRGLNNPVNGISAFRMVRKFINPTYEFYLEAQCAPGGTPFGANSLRAVVRPLVDGSIAGTDRPVIDFSAAELIGGAILVQGSLTLRLATAGNFDYVVWGFACPAGGGNFAAASFDATGRLHLNDARGAGLQAGAGNVLDVFAAAKLWARGGTDGRTVTPSTPALPRLVRGTVTPAASVAFTHNLNTTDPAAVQVSLAASPFTVARPDSLSFAANAVTLTWAAPPSGLHNIVIIG